MPHLRQYYQQRNRLRLIVDYRRKFLDSLVRGGEEEAKQADKLAEEIKELGGGEGSRIG